MVTSSAGSGMSWPVELGQVGALQVDHSRIHAQAAAQLAGAHVYGVDTRGAGVEERLGEAARRRAKIERDNASRADIRRPAGRGRA